MSLIVTQITENGLVFASDSNLTSSVTGLVTREAPKTFSLPQQKGAVQICGSYSANGVSIDSLVSDAIANDTGLKFSEFVTDVFDRLNASGLSGVILHLAGYGQDGSGGEPDFWHISDLDVDEATGEYKSKKNGFQKENDILRYKNDGSIQYPLNQPLWFTNGLPSGRDAYVAFLKAMSLMRHRLFIDASSPFEKPDSIEVEADYLRLDMEQVAALFKSSNLAGVPIGGKISVLTVPKP